MAWRPNAGLIAFALANAATLCDVESTSNDSQQFLNGWILFF
jgi:hypothetical protein